jgi:hypothetical protein
MAENPEEPPPRHPPTLNDVLHQLADFVGNISRILASVRADVQQMKAREVDQENAIQSLRERIEVLAKNI